MPKPASYYQQIEDRFFARRKSVTPDEIFDLAQYRASHMEQEVKKQQQTTSSAVKKYRTVEATATKTTIFIDAAYQAGRRSQTDLELYINFFRTIRKVRVPIKYISAWMEVTGRQEVKNIKVKRGWMDIESGMCGIGDVTLAPDWRGVRGEDRIEEARLEHMHRGEVFYVCTGGDGNMGAEIRLVAGDIPSISRKEYAICRGDSGPVILRIPSGTVRLSDMHVIAQAMKDRGYGVEMQLAPGNYSVAVFLLTIPGKFYKFVAVLCPTGMKAANRIDRIDLLEA